MKVGDLVKSIDDWDLDLTDTGVVVNMELEYPEVEILWDTGDIWKESCWNLEIVSESR